MNTAAWRAADGRRRAPRVRTWALSLLTLVLFLFTAACGNGARGSGNTGDAPPAAGDGNGGGAAAGDKPTLVFGDFSWDSVQVHNRIAGFIIEHGYGYPVDYKFGDTIPILQGLQDGSVHITMEMWPDNIREAWQKALDSGKVLDLGQNYPESPQGWYVPAYVIKGDPERGIEPMAPDLRSVQDLERYWQLFEDPSEPGKGRFYNCPTGWVCSDINAQKLKAYGLDDHFTAFNPGSEAGLNTSITTAYRQGKPWVGYYWEPTWITGKYELIRLEEPAYSEECWNSGKACAYPPSQVLVAANSRLQDMAPDVVEFLKKYETTLDQTAAALAYMEEQGGDPAGAAHWFLKTYHDWEQWVPAEVHQRVKQALEEVN
ncbi:ABC transporter substrate-binding protein [Thermaerobacter subterraneus]|uniref:ABC-type proline/glycine betaine transport system, periplasmic component n=1 Tax=Thermaerobacter subterraneus DSM 13965 TaxID=867903 RepID=K6PMZ3_9FIRM|nr:ABC transporter substrate-binding protein [Thermaerobacter subterraneus]EKP94277.1 ABC-type proline/glycine betaine transport system, periplasmic component [Thermaerobacter subterraneus DSM 13965]